jgi:hypothetical protein
VLVIVGNTPALWLLSVMKAVPRPRPAQASCGPQRPRTAPSFCAFGGLLFDDDGTTAWEPWKGHAREWFTRYVDDTRNARFPAIEVDGELVATAIGTLEIGVPNPQCARDGADMRSSVSP